MNESAGSQPHAGNNVRPSRWGSGCGLALARVLLTEMSGTGKSTPLDVLSKRGHQVLDTDDDGRVPDDATWHAPRLRASLRRIPAVVVSGSREPGRLLPVVRARRTETTVCGELSD